MFVTPRPDNNRCLWAALGSAVINNAEMDADNFDQLNADQKLCQYERQITTVYIAWVFAGFQGQPTSTTQTLQRCNVFTALKNVNPATYGTTVTSDNDGRH